MSVLELRMQEWELGHFLWLPKMYCFEGQMDRKKETRIQGRGRKGSSRHTGVLTRPKLGWAESKWNLNHGVKRVQQKWERHPSTQRQKHIWCVLMSVWSVLMSLEFIQETMESRWGCKWEGAISRHAFKIDHYAYCVGNGFLRTGMGGREENSEVAVIK